MRHDDMRELTSATGDVTQMFRARQSTTRLGEEGGVVTVPGHKPVSSHVTACSRDRRTHQANWFRK